MGIAVEREIIRPMQVWKNYVKRIRYVRFNSAVVRTILGIAYRPGTPYRIWFGPLRGVEMYYDRTINYHAILGLWEAEIFSLLDRIFVRGGLLREDSVIADVGANIGYYTIWFSKVATRGRVFAFEPSVNTLRVLTKNLDLNHIANAEVIASACGDHVGTADFFIAGHHHASSLHRQWAEGDRGKADMVTVSLTSLDAFFCSETGRRAPDFIKMDIEGGGTYALKGCIRIFQDTRPYILIESHTPDEDRAISDVLIKHKYCGYRINDNKWVKNPHSTHPDKEGVWGTLLLTPEERRTSVAVAIAN